MAEEQKLSGLQQFFLVATRVAIGWHFLHEGLTKLESVTWSSKGYLANATGPFASTIHGLVQDVSATIDGKSVLQTSQLVSFSDTMIPWALTLAGIGLILGLLTRTSTVVAIGLLALFYITAPGWDPYGRQQPFTEGSYLLVTKNLVELIALCALLTFRTGLIAGLDMLIHQYLSPLFKKEVRATEPVRKS